MAKRGISHLYAVICAEFMRSGSTRTTVYCHLVILIWLNRYFYFIDRQFLFFMFFTKWKISFLNKKNRLIFGINLNFKVFRKKSCMSFIIKIRLFPQKLTNDREMISLIAYKCISLWYITIIRYNCNIWTHTHRPSSDDTKKHAHTLAVLCTHEQTESVEFCESTITGSTLHDHFIYSQMTVN